MCGACSFDWDYGDGSSHGTGPGSSHTYGTPATYNWRLTVSVNGETCTKTGSVVVVSPCTLVCTATVPTTGTAGQSVGFASTATPSNCSGAPSYDWDFGDGTAHSSQQNPSHSYATPSTRTWILTVTAGGQTCTKTGTISICTPVSIATQPASASVFPGQRTTLAVIASGSGALSYQWYQGVSGNTSTPVGANAQTFLTPDLTVTTGYWVRVTSACGMPADSATATITVCSVSCSAASSPVSSVGPLTANFSGAGAISGGCPGMVFYDWNFGDGSAHTTIQSPSHTYTDAGTYTWSLAVSAGGQTCSKLGTVVVCSLNSTATVPPRGTSGLAVACLGSGSISGGCAPTIAYDWDFGDGSTHSTMQNPSHTYASANTYNWTLRVTAGGGTSTKTGSITIVNPPVIGLIKKLTPPFKLVVTGSNLQSGLQVFINGIPWTSVVWKNSEKIQLTGAIKTAVPKGSTKTFRFVNPDGGEASQTWGW